MTTTLLIEVLLLKYGAVERLVGNLYRIAGAAAATAVAPFKKLLRDIFLSIIVT